MNAVYDNLAFVDSIFLGVDPSVKLDHSWNKLRDFFKGLTKSYGEIFENHRKSGNHDDFINFCGSKSEVFYLYLWLKDKPQLEPMVVIDLPEGAFLTVKEKMIMKFGVGHLQLLQTLLIIVTTFGASDGMYAS